MLGLMMCRCECQVGRRETSGCWCKICSPGDELLTGNLSIAYWFTFMFIHLL